MDEELARRVADGLGLQDLPPATAAANPVAGLPPSPPLSIVANMKDTLEGRSVGILFDEGSDRSAIDALRSAIEGEGATVRLVAPKVGGARLADGSHLPADGQLAGSPSVLFDAIAILLAPEAAQKLCMEGAAVEFARHAFAHLKAIAVDEGGRRLLEQARVEPDEAVVEAGDVDAFVRFARTRQWEREPKVRTLH